MTREEAWNRIDAIIARHEIDDEYVTITSFLDYDALRMARKALKQQPKTGHWIEHPHEAGPNWEYSRYECSECHDWAEDDSDYCSYCGAKMVEPQEGAGRNDKL